MNRSTRILATGGFVAMLAAGVIAAELVRPGFWSMFGAFLIVAGQRLLMAAGWVALGAVLVGLGYGLCRWIHHQAIRDAGVERLHEQRITTMRGDNLRLVRELQREGWRN